MHCNRIRFVSAIVLVGAMFGLSIPSSAIDVLWDGGGDGTSWDDNLNWVGNSGPGNGDDRGILGDTTVNRTVTVNGFSPDESLGWNQSTGGGVVNKIQLNTDWIPSQCCHQDLNYTNTTGDPNALVLDLNGFRRTQLQGPSHVFPPMTIMSSQPGGELVYARKMEWTTSQVVVGADVTIRSVFGGYNNTYNGPDGYLTWDPTSKLIIEGDSGVFTGTTRVGDLDVINQPGAEGGLFSNNGTFEVQGDVNVEVGSRIDLLQGIPQQFRLHGNITDLNTTGDYTNGRLEFQGPGDVQQINIHRTLQNSINIKGNANVELLHDLNASANTAINPHESTWLTAGTIDLNGFDFLTNQLVVGEGTDIIWGAGTDSSVIDVTDGLGNIGQFNVQITDQGGWNSGNDFVLFDYHGVTKGLYGPTLGSVSLPSGWSHDGLSDTGTQLVLLNLVGTSVPSLMDFEWTHTGSGDWNTGSHWNPAQVPNSLAAAVLFGSAITSDADVTVAADLTVAQIEFNHTNSYRLTGAGAIYLNGNTVAEGASVTATAGNHVIDVNLNIQSDATVNVALGSTLSVSAMDLGGNTVSKTGAGRLDVNGIPGTSHGSLVVSDGSVGGTGTLGGGLDNQNIVAPGNSIGVLTVAAGYSQSSSATLSIEIAGDGAAGDSNGHDQLAITDAAVLGGDLVVTATGFDGTRGAEYTIPVLTASSLIGTFDNEPTAGEHLGFGLFAGNGQGGPVVTYNNTSAQLTYLAAQLGDADGDRDVDITDFNTLSSNFSPAGIDNTWTDADFDFDGDVDITDFNGLSANFSPGGYGSAEASQVPEPTSFGLLGLGCLLLSYLGLINNRRPEN